MKPHSKYIIFGFCLGVATILGGIVGYEWLTQAPQPKLKFASIEACRQHMIDEIRKDAEKSPREDLKYWVDIDISIINDGDRDKYCYE
jgi:hypothetical protein